MLAIGSLALNKIQGVNDTKELSDYDFIATPSELNDLICYFGEKLIHLKTPSKYKKILFIIGQPPIEIEIARDNNSAEQLLNIIKNEKFADNLIYCYGEKFGNFVIYPTIDVLYALKLSHRFLKNSPHFIKTMRFIQDYRINRRYNIPIELEEWFKIREEETYNYKHPNLKKNKEEFFSNDGVNYIFEHDSIHEAVKLGTIPAYKLAKNNENDVSLSKEKFFNLSKNEQLNTVHEEAYVLALERSLIPSNFKNNYLESFRTALEKICTSISSGWWREFAWENYDELYYRYSDRFVYDFLMAYYQGNLKKLEQ